MVLTAVGADDRGKVKEREITKDKKKKMKNLPKTKRDPSTLETNVLENQKNENINALKIV